MPSKFSTRNLIVKVKNDSIDRVFQNLNIRTVVTKTLSANPNQAVIEIYNLNQNSREELFNSTYSYKEGKATTEVTIILDGIVIFGGQLINVTSTYSVAAAEWKTTLYCGNGFNAFKQKINKKYPKGTTSLEILQDMGKVLESEGVAVMGAIKGLTDCLKGRSIAKAILINGEIIANMKKIMAQCFGSDFDAHVGDGGVLHLTVGKAPAKRKVEVVNKGLISPPSLSEQGINLKLVLNHELSVGNHFLIEARSFNIAYGNLTVNRPSKSRISGDGTFRVSQIKHVVDNYSQEVATTEVIGVSVS